MKLFLLIFSVSILFAQKPELLMLNKYSEDINVSSWYMSEKLDGVRAYWDGKNLISRSGKVFASPKFFTDKFPKYKLDGELWSKQRDFSNIISIVNQKIPHNRWKNLTYNIFEVPEKDGNLTQRLTGIKIGKHLKIIKQTRIKDKTHLNKFMKEVEEKGGEGIVIRDGSLNYYTGRNNNALKMKRYIDDECEVVGYNNGNGKYNGMVGSLSCRMKNMQVIKIGSGLTKHQRTIPPEIGTVITFKYYGLTSKGNPRFPIF